MPNNADTSGNACQNGQLFVVATPIGNLSDMSPHAIDTLVAVDLIACEDTRHTKNLCRYFAINTPLVSYYREKEQEKSDQLLAQLLSGKQIALVSDAGTPAISDPGALLVRKARKAGIKVTAIAGPSALTAALSVAGLATTNFFFGGFLPAHSSERKRQLQALAPLPCPLVFYESPHRIHAALADMKTCLGDRQAQLFREISKIHEQCVEGTLATLQDYTAGGVKGEMVVIVQGAPLPGKDKPDNVDDLLLWYRDVRHTSLKHAVSSIAADLDLPRTQVYKRALALWDTP